MKTINIRISPKAQIFLVLAVVLYFLIPRAIDVALNFATIGFGEVDPSTNSRYVIAIDPNNWANVAVAKRIPERIAGYNLYVNREEVLPVYYQEASGIPNLVWVEGKLYFTADYGSSLWSVVPGSPASSMVLYTPESSWETGMTEISYFNDITRWKDGLYVVGGSEADNEAGWSSDVYHLDGDNIPTRITESGYALYVAGGPTYLAVQYYYCMESSFCGDIELISEETIGNKWWNRGIQYWDLHYAENPRWIGPFLWVTRGEYHPYFGIPDTFTMPRQ